MVLLRSSVTRTSLLLGVALDTAIGVHTADDTVGLGEDLAAVLDERLDCLDKLFLVTLLLGLALLGVNLLVDALADGADLVEALLNLVAKLAGELLVLLSLLARLLLLGSLLFLLLGLLGHVLNEDDVAHGLTLGVENITVVINLLAGADHGLAADELANNLTALVADVTVLGHGEAGHGALLLLLRLRLLPALSLAKDVAVGVNNLTIIVHGTTSEGLGVA